MILSVLMPIYNAESYVSHAIEALLTDHNADLELIAIDDGSTDRSRKILEDFALTDARIRFSSRQNKGIAATRNELLSLTRGEFMAWADSDDIRPIDGLKSQVRFLRENREYIAVCGGFSMISENGEKLSDLNSHQPAREISHDLRTGKLQSSLCTFVIRTSSCGDLRFRTWFQSGEDVDYQCRLAQLGRIYFQQGNFYQYRLCADSITHTLAENKRQFFHDAALRFAVQRQFGKDDLEKGNPPELPNFETKPQSHREHEADILLGVAWSTLAEGRRFVAIRTLFRAVRSMPLRPDLWYQFMLIVFKALTPMKTR